MQYAQPVYLRNQSTQTQHRRALRPLLGLSSSTASFPPCLQSSQDAVAAAPCSSAAPQLPALQSRRRRHCPLPLSPADQFAAPPSSSASSPLCLFPIAVDGFVFLHHAYFVTARTRVRLPASPTQFRRRRNSQVSSAVILAAAISLNSLASAA
ncbi:hypothetical protein M0R45_035659 [Rubus argutus]|uniref:Uncharacterized protein n=1 Tax=Rubus argutus TaxID=59490 RepID=A0AAW1VTS7_RUBAR